MKFEDVRLKKAKRCSKKNFCEKSMFWERMPSLKPWLKDMDLMYSTFHEKSNSKIISSTYFVVYIDDKTVVISDESKNLLMVYNTVSGTLIHTHQCDSKPYDMCYAFSMNIIYVAFENFVVQYEIKKRVMKFIKREKIQVEGVVQGIAKTIDGYFSANGSSVSFRWSNFQ